MNLVFQFRTTVWILAIIIHADGLSTRRSWCRNIISATTSSILITPTAINALDEFPMPLRSLTRLAPLGKPEKTLKTVGLSMEQLTERLSHDLLFGSTNTVGSYLLTGDFSEDIFEDDCTFIDPNNKISSLSQCRNALRILFDPTSSKVEIIQPLTIIVNQNHKTIQGKIRVRGYLQFPWNPYITAYESNIVYTVNNDNGLISQQEQQWSKSATKALQESFTPTLFSPPLSTSLLPNNDEPREVTQLLNYVNGRYPDEYSMEERMDIDNLIDNIVSKKYPSSNLRGKWMLVYLQPGSNGAGIDRRIPFPEFSFNHNYQIFTTDSVTNIGEVFGPNVFVKVFGNIKEDDPTSLISPKRFQANIYGGKLCLKEQCINLPIAGEGIFDSVYLGDRLRIGQNLNGGGARAVQIRLS